jgi:hypothetical protein
MKQLAVLLITYVLLHGGFFEASIIDKATDIGMSRQHIDNYNNTDFPDFSLSLSVSGRLYICT